MALEIDTALDARAPLESKTKNSGSLGISLPLLGNKISHKDRMFFTEQLALLLATGASLHPALISIAGQVNGKPIQPIVESMAEGVMNGRALSEELARHPQVFSPVYVNLVAASEGGGFLSDVLEQLCEIEQKNDELRATLISAFSYPAFLVVFSIFTLCFVLLFIFPKFAALFTSIADQLPTSTKVLMGVSTFFLNHWIESTIVFCLGVFGLLSWMTSARGKLFIDRAKLGLPGLRGLWSMVYSVLLLRTLGLSLQHGVTLVDGVRTSRDVTGNHLVGASLHQLSLTLEQGGKLSQGLQQNEWLPSLAKQMLTTGEESGSLAAVMLRLSEHYSRELDRLLQRFTKMVEPIMLVLMGALVGLLVSSMILPIFKLSHAVT